jgi:hypothetical protein
MLWCLFKVLPWLQGTQASYQETGLVEAARDIGSSLEKVLIQPLYEEQA